MAMSVSPTGAGGLSITKQAGVGLMLGEDPSGDGVIVKQLVPRGSADRTGRIRTGDHLLRVGDSDVAEQKVHDMRHLIIGEIGSVCTITFRSASTAQVYSVDLVRGTPEYFDSLGSGTTSSSRPPVTDGASRMYMSKGSSIISEAGGQHPLPSGASLQDENDWLRSALRLAEQHMTKDKEELRSLYGIFERHKAEADSRSNLYNESISKCDAEKREAERRAWAAEEAKRACDVKLSEAAKRELTSKEDARKNYENEQMRLEYIQDLKRKFEDEKTKLEGELVRMHDSLRGERAKRVEIEALEANLRQELAQVVQAYRQVVEKNNAACEQIRSEAESLREIQRHNSSLTLLLSEIQPRLTVLEQDMYGSKVDYDSVYKGRSLSAHRDDEIIMA